MMADFFNAYWFANLNKFIKPDSRRNQNEI